MSAPQLTVYINGGPGVSGDNFNTYEQTCDTASQLRNFIGVQGIQVFMRGQSAVNDGYQGNFWWNFSASNPTDDNGVTTIVPNGAGTGCWSRINDVNNTYTYLVPLTGFSLQIGNGIGSLILNPAGTLATGAITMPATPLDGQITRFSSTQIVTALTVNTTAGQTIFNAPTSLAVGIGNAFQYVLIQKSWFRVP